ncbi:T9SS type A sorting domain-containing protein [Winogradskyella jejuensis]|nr:T9SS type A sorting domain-containing protein [Winogradskyella jejuensis]
MKKIYFLFLLITTLTFSQTTLNQGEVMIIGFHFDSDVPAPNCGDGFTFTSYVDLLPGTQIRFSEDEFSQWPTQSEGGLLWTNTEGETIPSLTAIRIDGNSSTSSTCNVPTVNIGSVVYDGSGSFALSTSGEEIIIYQSSASQTLGTPISLFQSDEVADLPTGLNPAYVINFDIQAPDADIGVYTGPSTFSSLADFASQITNVVNNWNTQDGSGNNGNDNVSPDYPDDLNSGFAQTLSLDLFSLSASLTVFPNPTNGSKFVNISSGFDSKKKVTLYNLLGERLITREIDAVLDISNLSAGIYLLKINQNNSTITKKLIIK